MIQLVKLIQLVAQVFQIMIIARAILSWFKVNPYNQAYQYLIKFTDPVLDKIRFYLDKFLPDMGFDISPIIALFLIDFLEKIVIRIITH